MSRLLLYGASGHAKVIIDILQQNGDADFLLLDDNPDINNLNGVQVIHPQDIEINVSDKFLVTIGVNRTRKLVSEKIDNQFFSAIHPYAQINTNVTIHDGSMVAAGVVINSDTTLGHHCIINTNSSIDHDCSLDDFVHVAPGATICGGVSIGEGTLIGAGATVLPNLSIGKWAKVGAGAVVTQNVSDMVTVVGVPAKPMRN